MAGGRGRRQRQEAEAEAGGRRQEAGGRGITSKDATGHKDTV